MESMINSKRLLVSVLILTLVYVICFFFVFKMFRPSSDSSDTIEKYAAKIEAIQIQIQGLNRLSQSMGKIDQKNYTYVLDQLEQMGAAVKQSATINDKTTQEIHTRHQKFATWLKIQSDTVSGSIDHMGKSIDSFVNKEGLEQLKTGIDAFPDSADANALAEQIDQYQIDMDESIEKIGQALSTYPKKGDLEDISGQLISLKRLSKTQPMVQNLPDVTGVTNTLDQVITHIPETKVIDTLENMPSVEQILSKIDPSFRTDFVDQVKALIGDHPRKDEIDSSLDNIVDLSSVDILRQTIKTLPDKTNLLKQINAHDAIIKKQLAGLKTDLSGLKIKKQLIDDLSVLTSLDALNSLKAVIDTMPDSDVFESLMGQLPTITPIQDSRVFLSGIPDKTELALIVKTIAGFEQMEQSKQTLAGLTQEGAFLGILKTSLNEQFPLPDTYNNSSLQTISGTIESTENQITGFDAILAEQLAGSIKATQDAVIAAKNLQSILKSHIEINSVNQNKILSVLFGYLILMLIFFAVLAVKKLKPKQSKIDSGDLNSDFLSEDLSDILWDKDTAEIAVSLKTITEQMPDVLDTVVTHAMKNLEKSKQISSSAQTVHSNIEGVAKAMTFASNNLSTISTAADGITTRITEIAENAENARNVTGQAVLQAKITTDKVSELGSATNEIDKVTHTINEISEQTKLLALNATIEAARAGEAGKGFAVVANEVKTLARQTAEATLDIRKKIEHINSITEEAVNQIRQISNSINDSDEIVSSIAKSVDDQSVSTKEIAENVAQASQGITEVSSKVFSNLTFMDQIIEEENNIEDKSKKIFTDTKGISKSVNAQKELINRLYQKIPAKKE